MSNEEMEVASKEESGKERKTDREKCHKCNVPPMKINCNLEVTVGSKNKIIYVCPGKLQYFTASAICGSCDKTIEIEYCGRNTRCICGEVVISGCLGYYKIVKSGIIFIPSHRLSEFHNDMFATDILSFNVKDECDKGVKFDVVFTYSKCVDCGCNKSCKC